MEKERLNTRVRTAKPNLGMIELLKSLPEGWSQGLLRAREEAQKRKRDGLEDDLIGHPHDGAEDQAGEGTKETEAVGENCERGGN